MIIILILLIDTKYIDPILLVDNSLFLEQYASVLMTSKNLIETNNSIPHLSTDHQTKHFKSRRSVNLKNKNEKNRKNLLS